MLRSTSRREDAKVSDVMTRKKTALAGSEPLKKMENLI
jgi:hypothetical protein